MLLLPTLFHAMRSSCRSVQLMCTCVKRTTHTIVQRRPNGLPLLLVFPRVASRLPSLLLSPAIPRHH